MMRANWAIATVVAMFLSTLVVSQTVLGQGVRGRRGPGKSGPSAAAKKWNEAEYVFTGKLDSVDAGPVGRSFPPMYTHTLHFTVERVLRGPLKPGAKVDGSHVARQHNRPLFPVGKVCLVVSKKSRGRLVIQIVEESSEEKLAEVAMACALPMGWKVEQGKPVSPWASLGKKAWSATTDEKSNIVCSKTSRPALMAGSGVTFQVEPVPPAKKLKWTNPDGDGEYKITITNSTDKSITVPALLSQGGKTLWKESLAIICQNKVYPCPGSQGVAGEVHATKLKPGESISTTVNAFGLKGPEWPRGGYRIEFRFCLGEMSQTKSFYYMSRHHDKLREAVSK